MPDSCVGLGPAVEPEVRSVTLSALSAERATGPLRIVVADVGGTNCRLGCFRAEGECLTLDRTARLTTSKLADTRNFIAALEESLELSLATADMLVVAAAGPVRDGTRVDLTNSPLRLDFTDMAHAGSFGDVDSQCARGKPGIVLLNDCTAHAWACITEVGRAARCILGPELSSTDSTASTASTACLPKAADTPALRGTPVAPVRLSGQGGQGTGHAFTSFGVVGAGTGLGMAALLADECGGYLAVPSEGGHAEFPFLGQEENKIHDFFCVALHRPYASCEDVLCGRGLALLHQWASGQSLPPDQLEAEALHVDSPTLPLYARFYGRFCRSRALATLCDGLWIVGGIAGRNPHCVANEHFSGEFFASAQAEHFLRATSVYLTENTDSGLWGAARAGLDRLRRRAG